MELFLSVVYSGLLLGGTYALVALGLALVFGAMKIINLSHGELVVLAAYIAYTVEARTGVNPMYAIPLAVVVVCVCNLIVYLLISRIRHDRELNSLLLTYGLGVVLTNSMLLIWSADLRSTSSEWMQEAASMGPFSSMRSELIAFVISGALMLVLWRWLSKSWYGRAVRAVSSNREAAALMGINPFRAELVSFLVAGLLASFAGVSIYSSQVIQPALGPHLTITAFIITVLAGVGSIHGVFIGAVLLGVSEALTTVFLSSSMRELSGMVILILVLFMLPNGLFGATARRG